MHEPLSRGQINNLLINAKALKEQLLTSTDPQEQQSLQQQIDDIQARLCRGVVGYTEPVPSGSTVEQAVNEIITLYTTFIGEIANGQLVTDELVIQFYRIMLSTEE